MKKLLILSVLVLSGTLTLYAQGELNEQQKVFFRNEKSFAFLLNTDGWGLSYRAAKRIDFLNKNLLEIDFGIMKSAKEYTAKCTAFWKTKEGQELNELNFARSPLDDRRAPVSFNRPQLP